jgi:flagellar assembly factor FliW
MQTDTTGKKIKTANFGEICVPEDKVISFKQGIPGFPSVHEFAILGFDDLSPFQYLQSLGDPAIALLIVNPFLFVPSYKFDLSPADMEELRCERPEEVSVFAVATIPADPADATVNLMAPVLINAKERCGKQVILLEGSYPMRHPLISPGQHGAGT